LHAQAFCEFFEFLDPRLPLIEQAMTPQAPKPGPKINRTLAAGIFILLLAGLCAWYLVTPKSQSQPLGNSVGHEASAESLPSKQTDEAQMEDPSPAPQKRARGESRSARASNPATFPQIDSVLTDDRISDEEAARQLAEIALNPNAPEAERLEAMEHGKNLGFAHLLPLSLDPNLPLPLAESFLHGLHGHDQTKEQVSGALGLLNHADSDIREQAQTLLGFLLEAEEDNESPDKLREKADAFLRQPDGGDGGEEMNIEHPTSNIEHRSGRE
jgi:hypothetical protein